ncbi:FAD:protein FMN transferase [Companilactobacillus crustorum]|uniref:FAD:protein FMN transferase n=3 Tax=Companilactobacillus TaxID=2767879 RepID=A0A837RHS9_9LACO|nr:FAD:protein FMN transferase [Companilactobacillus crustorum]HCD07509.1 FAD:protein FMN transferase [Lactobacillus sp.]KRK42871.1 thiamine biosynthesis lipoprotein apbE precursor [Companilactobacillus crustorum JCM 15951]KRO20561.1 thiamine biosynthesis lipoprotein apbE precursor [Companilactobacillus crustorum]WDT65349.1 FAD:protein FMN transferase [Companilactobacillus crustorum]GEO76743.1 FAD:protein FMN transferase [Companilactobacillus crustorum]
MSNFTNTYHALGTEIKLTVFQEGQVPALDKAYDLIQYCEDLLTVNRTKSEIMSINQASGKYAVPVSQISYDLVKEAVRVSQENHGFNAAIGPLVKLWHIGFSDAEVPSENEIDHRLKLTNPGRIMLNDRERSVYLLDEGMELDLGGIAKGYIADAIKKLWLENGIDQGIIDLGGNVLLVGKSDHESGLWNVGVQSPFDTRDDYLGVLKTMDYSIVTSGIYERFLNKKGHSYHHIMDPKTGYPVKTDLLGVTVVSPRSIDGEIWSSLGFYNNYAGTLKLLDNNSIGLIFVYKDRTIRLTDNLKKKFTLTDTSFTLV